MPRKPPRSSPSLPDLSSPPAAPAGAPGARVRMHKHGLDLGKGQVLPLWAGAMHYWRHPRHEWRAGLEAMRAMGLRVLDTYVPWGVHERAPGDFDFGQHDSRHDVAGFLELAHDVGLQCVAPARAAHQRRAHVLRHPRARRVGRRVPGAHGGRPPRDAAHGARRVPRPQLRERRVPRGDGTLVPRRRRAALAAALARRAHRAGAGRQRGRALLPRRRLRSGLPPRRAAGLPRSSCAPSTGTCARCATPGRTRRRRSPRSSRRAASTPSGCRTWPGTSTGPSSTSSCCRPRWSAWPRALVDAGFDGIPTSHNLPLGEAATPLNPARMTAIDLVGLDYYHKANPAEHWTILRRTTELASRCEGRDRPAFGAEFGAGFPPFFAPLDELDSMYALMAAMAYGLQGLQPVHGRRARPVDRRAHRSARPAAAHGGALPETARGASRR